MSLPGIGDSPIPRIARLFLFGQGDSTGAGTGKPVVLVGNKTSAGSETVETLGTAIQSQSDADARFGPRSEMRWIYYAFSLIPQQGEVYGVAVAENGAAAAATVTFTFTTTADGASNILITWGGFTLSVPVKSGDTAIQQCAAAVAKINADPHLPFTAAQQAPANDHKMDITCANKGPRGGQILAALRVSYDTTIATTVSKGSVGAGTGADDVTNALAVLAGREFTYHVPACTASAGVTATDGGVGQYCNFIKTQALPAVGFDQMVVFGLDCTQANGTSVATSSAANSVYAFFFRVKNNDWSTPMIAAFHASMMRSQQIAYPAFNFAGYTSSDTTPYPIPPPFSASDRPTSTEMLADLNNGICTVGFRDAGQAYLVRHITSSSWTGSSATKDYRAREGHIPATVFAAWEFFEQRYVATKQPNVADDPPAGVRPLPKVTYPRTIKSLATSVINILSGPRSPYQSAPILDPGGVSDMLNVISAVHKPGGFDISLTFLPVQHNLFTDVTVAQGGPAY